MEARIPSAPRRKIALYIGLKSCCSSRKRSVTKSARDKNEGKRTEIEQDRRQAASQNLTSGRTPKHVTMADAIMLKDSTEGKVSTPMAFGW
jgi:hypothetical protein